MGDKEEQSEINVSDLSVFSSLPEPTQNIVGYDERARTIRQETIEVKVFADFCRENRLEVSGALLKVDTQGYEMKVLKGAEPILEQLKLIQLEIAPNENYKDQATIGSTVEWLRERHFAPLLITPVSFDMKQKRILDFDFVFINKNATRED